MKVHPDLQRLIKSVTAQPPEFWRGYKALYSITNPITGNRLDLLMHMSQLQIERVIHRPLGLIPMHCHPNVDTYELPLYGSGELWLGKRVFHLDDTYTPYKPLYLPRGYPHGGVSTERGGEFLSVQYWHVKPVGSIADDWESL